MRNLREFRSGKPGSYPDQSVYAEYACAEFGLAFEDIDGGTGLVFSVASATKSIHFGAGRCSWYPQNNATAATLASDKYFTNRILEERRRCHTRRRLFLPASRGIARFAPAGHEREDGLDYFRKLDGRAFVKPLLGSRGDFAQAIHGEAALIRYLDEVSPTLRFDPDPAGCLRGSNTGFSCSTTRCSMRRGNIRPLLGRWRASDPRSPGRAQCRACNPAAFRRLTLPR